MLNNEIYRNNLELFKKRFTNERQLIFYLESVELSSLKSFSFSDTVETKQKTNQLLEKVNLSAIKNLIVFGVEAFFCYDYLFSWLATNEQRSLVFIENKEEAVALFLSHPNASIILQDIQVLIYFFRETAHIQNISSSIASFFAMQPWSICAYEPYKIEQKQLLTMLTSHLSYAIFGHYHSLSEFEGLATSFFLNLFENVSSICQAHLAEKLFGCFKDIPAVICGAGPSLEKNGALLKKYYDKALIFAGGSALNGLDGLNVIPHIAAGVDPNPAQLSRLFSANCWMTPFFFRPRINHEALKAVYGDLVYLSGSAGHGLATWIEKQLNIENTQFISEGLNIVNLCSALAVALGCNPIIYVGLDMAYTQENSYASGVKPHPLFPNKEFYMTKYSDEELLVQNDIYGNPVHTVTKWVSESAWLARFVKNFPTTLFLNATEGGIGIVSVENLSLEKVAEKYLIKERDLRSYLHKVLQDNAPPMDISLSNVQTLFKELGSNFFSSKSICEEIIKNCDEVIEKLAGCDTDEQAIEIYETHQIKDLEKNIEDEILFAPFLCEFDSAFLNINRLNLQRLADNSFKFSLAALAFRKMALEKQRYQFLIKAIDATQLALDKASGEISEFQTQDLAVKKTAPTQQELYQIEKKGDQLRVIDTSSQKIIIDFFTPDQGSYSEKGYFFQGKLHGPIKFFSSKGICLAESLFIDGQKQGAAINFYADGSIYSRLFFNDGVFDGLQTYYFLDGCLRAKIPYHLGLLDGVVELYNSSGILERKIAFQNGKRHGEEFLYSSEGGLLMQLTFSSGKAIGKIKKWDKNGILISEEEITSERGALEANKDFFCLMADRSLFFGEGLKKMGEGLALCLKYLNKDEVLNEKIQKLLVEIENLQNLSKQLAETVNLYGTNPQEMIWKTPAVRHELEKKISTVYRVLSEQYSSLEHTFLRLQKAVGEKNEFTTQR